MVRATAHIHISPRPDHSRHLHVVPRRRRAAKFVVVLCAMVVVAMAGAAAFQTQLAQRQLELDRLDREIAAARNGYEILRRERAELRSPGRLALVASAAGMVPSKQSSFVELSPELVALVQEAVGPLAAAGMNGSDDPLAEFRLVKAIGTGTSDQATAP